MPTKAELYLQALKEMENSTEDILMSALVTTDGLIMASTDSNSVQNETFAAYSAVVFKRADETMELFSQEHIETLAFDSQNHRVVTVRAGEAILIALTGQNAPVGLLLLEMKNTALKVKELM